MTIFDTLVSPFTEYAFMRRALGACVILAFGSAPVGVLMNLRHMSLVGDAMSHAILPGVAIAFLAFGLSVVPMTIAALATGLIVALGAFALVRYTQLKEDSSFMLIYLLCLSIGVILISKSGTGIDLMHILFGNVLAIDRAAIMVAALSSIFSVFCVCLFYRSFVMGAFDPDFLSAIQRRTFAAGLFFVLVVVNLVAAFQVLGTLMSLGLMLLPAMTARFWVRRIEWMMLLSIALAVGAAYAGLLLSYFYGLPSGPAVVLTLGAVAGVSIFLGRIGSVRASFIKPL